MQCKIMRNECHEDMKRRLGVRKKRNVTNKRTEMHREELLAHKWEHMDQDQKYEADGKHRETQDLSSTTFFFIRVRSNRNPRPGLEKDDFEFRQPIPSPIREYRVWASSSALTSGCVGK